MEWKDMKHTLHTSQTVCDVTEERAVDMDVVLPDYCAPIAAILKCMMKPTITSCAVVGDRYTVDGITTVRMLYVSDDREKVHCYETAQPFNMAFRTQDAVHHMTTIKVDYVNCRATAPRRADIHGAFRVCMKGVGNGTVDVFSPPQDRDVFCRTMPLTCTVPTCEVIKTFSVDETIDLGVRVDRSIYTEATIASCECKPLQSKAIVKGILLVRSLYETDDRTAVTEQEIPFSQIVDVDGLCEEWQCDVLVNVCEQECHIQQGEAGSALLVVDVRLMSCIRCAVNEENTVVLDAYSVKEPVLCETMPLHTTTCVVCPIVKMNLAESAALPENISEILDAWGEIKSKDVHSEHGANTLTCCTTASIVYKDADGHIAYCERTVDLSSPCDSSWNDIRAELVCMKATVQGDSLRIQGDILVMPYSEETKAATAVGHVMADERTTFSRSAAAIRIVYADKGDSLWDIAKAHHASVDEIVAENDIHEDVFVAPTMLMIPMA